ncbi:SRPBCC family protein [Photobacterium lutimaris]|uniref:SRPBCC family protein n=1 Tax=Photobacterium lutimaris TaxID=388278 RepID=A0A2T3J2Y9_9GAMM|nr:SRPBCC family protein [Photobacterium lutimaris]PSU35654.1 SRPBCC family protein [Photobacterium lutimaris]TDR78711.1 polyketide cyclase/dehydrase/lipid transport protein [Photobacterium lutimaris]
MDMYTITLEKTAKVPKKVLFRLLTDHNNLGRFFDGQYSLIRKGKPESNGIGAIREISNGLLTFQEQVIDYKENEHLHYKIIQGAPVNEYGGWIKFNSVNAHDSMIHYRIMFTPKVKGTGWLIKYLFEKRIKRALDSLASYGEDSWLIENRISSK